MAEEKKLFITFSVHNSAYDILTVDELRKHSRGVCAYLSAKDFKKLTKRQLIEKLSKYGGSEIISSEELSIKRIVRLLNASYSMVIGPDYRTGEVRYYIGDEEDAYPNVRLIPDHVSHVQAEMLNKIAEEKDIFLDDMTYYEDGTIMEEVNKRIKNCLGFCCAYDEIPDLDNMIVQTKEGGIEMGKIKEIIREIEREKEQSYLNNKHKKDPFGPEW